jgi:hypothetical protein
MNRAIAAFVVVQMIGWGTTIYLPAVLLDRLRADLGLPAELVFSGVSIMLLVSALAAPVVGRAYDRHGTRGIMTAALAALVVGLKGPAQTAGRIGDLLFARVASPYRGMVGCLALMAMSLGGLAVLPFSLGVALLFTLAWGVADGMTTILRLALPLQLFGRARYGSLVGRILMPMHITSAPAPIIFAAIMELIGGVALLAFASLASVIVTGALLLLGRLIMPAKPREM